MSTPEQIRQRVAQADSARSARRSAAAQQVGELALRRAAVLGQLEEVEQALGDVLLAAQDVIDVDELARFTEVEAADLAQWLETRRTASTRRRKPRVDKGRKRTRTPAGASSPPEVVEAQAGRSEPTPPPEG
ncbi:MULTISPECIES: hypothetical protein [Actinosynnema]|uniref:hypothetical protein n=1 Tax=Actinosynnema TaxID=40566 RepID=UPI0020A27F98|nr:hypothetical protein [Actinosynnema pretiosum]MCP2098071.1 hypothetical protein [Actinosynnema pretiosum]